MRTLIKFGCDWRKIGRKGKCMKDSESTCYIFIYRKDLIFMENMLRVGVVTSTHGVRGEVKVFPTTDDAHRFDYLKSVLLDTGKELCELDIERVKYFKQYVILKFKDVDDINDIEPYKGKSLYVTREFAVPLKENEYYIADLIGMEVYLEDGKHFGTLMDVMETAIKDCIKEVDVENGKMVVHLLKGLC